MAAFERPSDPVDATREGDAGPEAGTPAASGVALPQWRSEDLLAGGHEARIAHGDTVYRLRVTMLGKLILTK